MRKQTPTITQGGALAVLVLTLLALALTGCGIGAAGDKEKISKTATTYLRALAAGDTAKACAQLTRRARGERCETASKERLARLEPDALKDAADGSLDIDVHGETATAGLSEPDGARFALTKVGSDWRIDSRTCSCSCSSRRNSRTATRSASRGLASRTARSCSAVSPRPGEV